MFPVKKSLKNFSITGALMGLALMIVSCMSPDDDKVTAPVIVSEPDQIQIVNEGETVKIGLKATGSKLKYLWLKDGIDTVGNADTLVLTQVDMDDAGFYSCVVSNDLLAVGSEMSELIVEPGEDTTTIPEDTTTIPEDTATVVDTRASISGMAKVTQIVAPVSSTPGTISTVEVDTYCEEGELITDSMDVESRYLISGGKLSLWEDGDCFVTKLSGSSSTIIGTWTANTLAFTDSVPAAFRAGCMEEDEGDVQFFDSVSVQYQVTSTQVNSQLSARVCYARVLGSFFTELEGEYQTVSDGCRESKIRNVEEGKTATFTSSYRNDTVSLGFSYNNKVCKGSTLTEFVTPTTCSDSDEDGLDAFFGCVVESGFYGSVGLEKRHALGKSFRKAVSNVRKPRVGGPF
jgi:hypothetical protein